MDVEILSRIQFAFTVAFHYIYPPMTIGLGLVMVIMEGAYLKTGFKLYHDMARFWTRVFGLIFSIGVATGIVMEFEFGTNWATYSRFVGDVFGSALAAEGIFAFFLESGFLAILLFGWDKVSKGMHFFATCMVCLGSHFSAVWIVVANSWMQTPAGYHLEVHGKAMPAGYLLKADELQHTRAVIDNFWELVFNPSSMDRLTHVILGAWITGAFLVISISAYYLLKGRHRSFAVSSLKIGVSFALVACFLQLASGDSTARGVANNQPLKLAAIEGLFETQPYAPLGIAGWVDLKDEQTNALQIPGFLSFLVSGHFDEPVTGLNAFPKEDWPNVPVVFQTYHLMIAIGMALVGLAVWAAFLWRRNGKLFDVDSPGVRFFLWILVFSVFLPQLANQAGWFTAEMGRQPWVVYGILRTSQGLSEAVVASQVLSSLIMFTFIYALLFALFIFLLHRKIQHGPVDTPQHETPEDHWQDHLDEPRA